MQRCLKHRSLLGWKLQHGGDAGRLCSRRQRMGDAERFKPDAGLDDLELLKGDVNLTPTLTTIHDPRSTIHDPRSTIHDP